MLAEEGALSGSAATRAAVRASPPLRVTIGAYADTFAPEVAPPNSDGSAGAHVLLSTPCHRKVAQRSARGADEEKNCEFKKT
jgi:hypothetical protein